MLSCRRCPFAVFLVASLISSQILAEEATTEESKTKKIPAWRRHSDQAIQSYRLQVPDRDLKVKLSDEPVFIHNFNVHMESHALVYLWTTKVGRPVAAVTSIIMRTDQDVDEWDQIDEFHSLHDDSFQATRDGSTVWRPQGPGLDWLEIPKAPKPARTERLQAAQASQLARRFSMTAIYRKENNRPWKLRLVPTPVNKYSTKDGDQIVSGYLHFFCRATDPEAMLALEVRRTESGQYRWHYAPANYSDAGMFMELDSKQVWKDDPARFGSRLRHFAILPNRGFSIGLGNPKPEGE